VPAFLGIEQVADIADGGARAFADGQIIQDHDVATLRGELGVDIGVEGCATIALCTIHGAVSRRMQTRDEGLGDPMAEGVFRRTLASMAGPLGRVSLVVTAVSSMNTRRPG
jgi:microcystin-dependent protein